MGMDSVELVLAFEEEFGIKIPDAAAEKMMTVGDVVDYVAAALLRSGRKADGLDVYLRVRGRVIAILNVEPDKVTRSSRFVEDLEMD